MPLPRHLSSLVLTLPLSIVLLAACSGGSNNPDGAPTGDGKPSDAPRSEGGVTPAAVMVTELMPDPGAVPDATGEWLELHNPTGAAVDIAGWTIKDDYTNSHVIQGPLVLAPGAYKVLARVSDPTQNGGIQGAYQYDNFNLANDSDQVILLDAQGKEVDRVVYDSTWGVRSGISLALRDVTQDNAKAASWCPSKDSWSGSAGDRGSPGAATTCSTTITPPDGGTGDGLPYLQHSISFKDYLCPGIESGTKKITIRNGHWDWVVAGEWVILKCSNTTKQFKAQLTMVRWTTYGGITPQEYMADGFSSQAEMLQSMSQYYPGITLSSDATVIAWKDTSPL